MSTRSIIARPSSDSFTGRYCHSDGYPSGVGKTLFFLYNEHFQRDAVAMMHYLIDEHPAGWSSLLPTYDYTLAPGFVESGWNGVDYDAYLKTENGRRPKCYCHGDRHEEESTFTSEDDTWCEWAYVVHEKTHHMYIMFCIGSENGKDQWRLVADIDLNDEEPDWKLIEASQQEED